MDSLSKNIKEHKFTFKAFSPNVKFQLVYFDLSDLLDEEWRNLGTNYPEAKVSVFDFRLQKELLVKLLILIKFASYMTF